MKDYNNGSKNKPGTYTYSVGKVKKIRRIGIRKVYDLEVEDNHNFFLANGILSHNSVDVDSRYNTNLVFASQTITQLPEAILRQARYIFIPATVDISTLRDALMSTGMIKNVQMSVNESIKLKNMMQRTPHSWVILDRTAGSRVVITPLPPLSYHAETNEN